MERLGKHARKWLSEEYQGIVAHTENADLTRKKAEHDAVLAEAFLLALSDRLNCFPTRNQNRGSVNRLYDLSRDHGLIKINFSGHHPFKKPGTSGCYLNDRVPVSIEFDKKSFENSVFKCPWPTRR